MMLPLAVGPLLLLLLLQFVLPLPLPLGLGLEPVLSASSHPCCCCRWLFLFCGEAVPVPYLGCVSRKREVLTLHSTVLGNIYIFALLCFGFGFFFFAWPGPVIRDDI